MALAIPSPTTQITVPVLEINGQKDAIFCGADSVVCTTSATLSQEEGPFFPFAQLQAVVIPETGHCLNLHYTAQSTYSIIGNWAGRHFPAH